MFICDFLSDRYFKVCVGNIYSDPYSQKEGVPQGSILSVTLFSLKINSIVSCLLPDIKCSLYVDDLAIYYSSSHIPSIERKLQQSLNRLGSEAFSLEEGRIVPLPLPRHVVRGDYLECLAM